jgi:biotin synthase-related radical SAM superfamily protein
VEPITGKELELDKEQQVEIYNKLREMSKLIIDGIEISNDIELAHKLNDLLGQFAKEAIVKCQTIIVKRN